MILNFRHLVDQLTQPTKTMRSFLVAILALTATTLFAQSAPDSLGFQGRLTDPGGVPIDTPAVPMTFKLYEGSSVVWSETQPSVEVVDGIFSVLLGSVTPLDTVRFNRPLSLGIKVGADPEISPRTPLAASAYAKAQPGMYTFYRDTGTDRSYNVIGGGSTNAVGAGVTGGTIGGGGGYQYSSPAPNQVVAAFGTVSGGAWNTASGISSTVGGGRANTAAGHEATVGGGLGNETSDDRTTIGGGGWNRAGNKEATVGGGKSNEATGMSSTVAGGADNIASSVQSTVGGGALNRATGIRSTVPGGFLNHATGHASFAAGYAAKALHGGTFVWNGSSSDTPDSLASTGTNQFLIGATGGVGIGTNAPNSQLTVSGDSDFDGRVVIGDQTPRTSLTVSGPNHPSDGPVMMLYNPSLDQVESGRIRFVEGSTHYRGGYIHYDALGNDFNIGVHNTADSLTASDNPIITIERASGDVGIRRGNPAYSLQVGTTTADGNGAYVTDGGVWTSTSSRSYKEDLREVDARAILQEVIDLPVYRWRYKDSDEGEHMGPVAEDFFEAFELGNDDRHISSLDGDGVALAAIQGLYELVKEQQAEIERMQEVIERAGLE